MNLKSLLAPGKILSNYVVILEQVCNAFARIIVSLNNKILYQPKLLWAVNVTTVAAMAYLFLSILNIWKHKLPSVLQRTLLWTKNFLLFCFIRGCFLIVWATLQTLIRLSKVGSLIRVCHNCTFLLSELLGKIKTNQSFSVLQKIIENRQLSPVPIQQHQRPNIDNSYISAYSVIVLSNLGWKYQ